MNFTAQYRAAVALLDPSKDTILATHFPLLAAVCNAGQVFSYQSVGFQAANGSGILALKNPTTGMPSVRMLLSGACTRKHEHEHCLQGCSDLFAAQQLHAT